MLFFIYSFYFYELEKLFGNVSDRLFLFLLCFVRLFFWFLFKILYRFVVFLILDKDGYILIFICYDFLIGYLIRDIII